MKLRATTANQGKSIIERQATSMRQAETEPKPVQKKEPSTHTCTPKMTNQVNERQPRGVEDRPKHTTPRTTHRKTSQGRESQAQCTQRLSTQWKKEARKAETGPQAPIVNSKERKHGKRETGPRHTTSINPARRKPKRGSETSPRHTVSITRMARSQLTRARSPAETVARPG